MARPSKIDRLPVEIREKIGELRRNGATIDEILAALDVAIGRSTMGRHIQKLDVIAARMQESRAVAEALVQRFGDAPESRVARMNIELMHGNLMGLLAGADGEAVTLEPQDAMFIGRCLKDLAQASKADADLTVKLRQQIEADLKQKAEKELKVIEGGLGTDKVTPAEVLARVRAIYGIAA